MQEITMLIVGAILVASPFIAFGRKWRRGIIILFLWLPLEGLARRILPDQQLLLIFVKDYILFWIYLRIFLVFPLRYDPLLRKYLLAPLIALIAITVVQMFNPNLPNIVIGLLGLKTYFYYVPLLLVGYWMFRSERELIGFVKLLMWTAIPLTLIAAIQILVPGFQFTEDDFTFSVLVRSTNIQGGLALPTSTFTGFGRYAGYMLLLAFIGIGMTGSTGRGGKWFRVGLIVAILGIIISGRRAHLFLFLGLSSLLIAVPLFYSGAARIRFQRRRVKSLLRSGLVGIATLSIIAFIAFPERTERLSSFYLFTLSEGVQEQVYDRFYKEVVDATVTVWQDIGAFGLGTGLYVQGVESFLGIDDRPGIRSDGFIPKIMAELGIIGLVAFGWFALNIARLSWRNLMNTRSGPWFFFGLSIFIYQISFFLISLKASSQFVDAYQQIYFWLFTGVLFGLARAAKKESTQGHSIGTPLRTSDANPN